MTDEIQKKEEIKPEEKKEVTEKDVLKRAEFLYNELKEKIPVGEAALKELKELTARNLLSGQTDMGVQPVPKKELTPKEYADLISKGIDPNKN